MRPFYLIILFCVIAGAVRSQGQGVASFDGEPYEQRQDISKAVNIYPNPAVEFVHIRLEHVNMDQVEIRMHNIIGNEIRIEKERVDEHEIRIRVKDFDTGYYLVALKEDQSKFRGTYKFLKR